MRLAYPLLLVCFVILGGCESDDRACGCFEIRDAPGELSPEGKTLDRFCSVDLLCNGFTVDTFGGGRALEDGAEPQVQCVIDALANGAIGTVVWTSQSDFNISEDHYITQHDDGRVFAWTQGFLDLNRETSAVREIELPAAESLRECAASTDAAAKVDCIYQAFEQPGLLECTQGFTYTDLF